MSDCESATNASSGDKESPGLKRDVTPMAPFREILEKLDTAKHMARDLAHAMSLNGRYENAAATIQQSHGLEVAMSIVRRIEAEARNTDEARRRSSTPSG